MDEIDTFNFQLAAQPGVEVTGAAETHVTINAKNRSFVSAREVRPSPKPRRSWSEEEGSPFFKPCRRWVISMLKPDAMHSICAVRVQFCC